MLGPLPSPDHLAQLLGVNPGDERQRVRNHRGTRVERVDTMGREPEG